ncbi:hypothetical protein EXIGLDRAFT_722673 [Exidia glandulosa HHB12029]|uniref:DUF6533 domain-containing protein n=1 Tax=Exidia glandulosa HHB12029 TaxID=1314781 RepID=A0A165F5W4_EXIGL|nr:hypothetical protein EXIGLDRAFT_722673 [Exidia glandulosa HHB12029]
MSSGNCVNCSKLKGHVYTRPNRPSRLRTPSLLAYPNDSGDSATPPRRPIPMPSDQCGFPHQSAEVNNGRLSVFVSDASVSAPMCAAPRPQKPEAPGYLFRTIRLPSVARSFFRPRMSPDEVLVLLERTQIVRYVHVTCAAVFAWEYALTFQAEYEFVWKAYWGAGKILFLLERYLVWPELAVVLFSDTANISAGRCHIVFGYTVWWTCFTVAIACLILIMRTWALWGAHRPTLLALLVMLSFGIIPSLYVSDLYIASAHFISLATLSPTQTGCALPQSGRSQWIAYVLSACFDLVILSMTVAKVHRGARRGVTSVISVLYRDGIIYFTCIFALSLLNLFLIATAPTQFIELLRIFHGVFHSILSCRVILHLRQASAVLEEDDDGAITITGTVSAWTWG